MKRYFAYIDSMEVDISDDDPRDFDEFVHWSDYEDAIASRDEWMNYAVCLDYRGADYCVMIHKELDGMEKENKEHHELTQHILADSLSLRKKIRKLEQEFRNIAYAKSESFGSAEAFMLWARGRARLMLGD